MLGYEIKMIDIKLVIHNKLDTWLEFPLWTSKQDFKINQVHVHACTRWVGLKDLETWPTLDDTSEFQKAKSEESSSSKVEVSIAQIEEASMYSMESCHMVNCQILIPILCPSTCFNTCKYLLAHVFIFIIPFVTESKI
jgi:hypothetical protein